MITFICAGILFISDAVGIKIFSARDADMHGTDTLMYNILHTAKELCKMVGIAIFCFATLRYIETDK